VIEQLPVDATCLLAEALGVAPAIGYEEARQDTGGRASQALARPLLLWPRLT